MTDQTTHHPDVLTTEEAAAYLRIAGPDSLKNIRERYGLKPLPFGQGLYHRSDLDEVVRQARNAIEQPKSPRQVKGEAQRRRRSPQDMGAATPLKIGSAVG